MDSYEATRQLAALAPGLPVIGQTAHATPEERARCLHAGMTAHLAKPILPGELVRVILGQVTRPVNHASSAATSILSAPQGRMPPE